MVKSGDDQSQDASAKQRSACMAFRVCLLVQAESTLAQEFFEVSPHLAAF